jgi:hypothetical protein
VITFCKRNHLDWSFGRANKQIADGLRYISTQTCQREERCVGDPALLIASTPLLEAFNPEKYGRRFEQVNLMDIDPDKLTPEQLDKIANHLLKQALGENAPIAEISWRLVAGEDLTFEQAKAIEAPKEAGK